MRRPLLLLVALLVAPAVPGAAVAHDHEPPDADLEIAGKDRSGAVWSSSWQSGGEAGCVGAIGDGTPVVRDYFGVAAGRHRVRVVFEKPQRPERVEIEVYKRLGQDRTPAGDPRVKTPDLRSRRVDGATVAWKAVFNLRVEDRRYVIASGGWRDSEGCGGNQHAAYVFPGIREKHPEYCPRGGDEDRFDTAKLVGRPLDRARRIARRHGCTVRVIKRDGKPLPGTDDFSRERANVVVRDGRVTRVYGVY